MISKSFLEKTGLTVPLEASSFYTEGDVIFFKIPFLDEYGCSIVIKEDIKKYRLTTDQVEALKTAGCYGPAGWTIV